MSEELIMDYNLFKRCRLCLQPASEMDSFFNIYYEDLSLAKVFKNITSYEIIEDDRLPKNICISCRRTIINFNNMISVFQDTELFLKNHVYKEEVLEEIDDIPAAENDDVILNQLNSLEDKSDADENDNFDQDEGEQSPDYNEGSYHEDAEGIVKPEILEVKKMQSFICPETVSSNGEYKYVNTQKYTCECGDSFLYKMGFRHHMQYRHNTMIDDNELAQYSQEIKLTIPTGFSNNIEFVAPRVAPKRNKLQCRVCSSLFSNEADVKRHEDVHKTHICDQCGAAFLKKNYLQDHQLTHSEDRRYKCKICSKAFKHRHTLSVHKRIHEDTKSFVCEICGTGFRQRATLVTHTLLKHSDVKNFPCPGCNLRFNLKATRDKHYVRKHTFNREKSFVCSKCGAAYLNKTTLTRHIGDKHLGKAKYYPCTICVDKMYVMKKGLRTHMMKKHGIFE